MASFICLILQSQCRWKDTASFCLYKATRTHFKVAVHSNHPLPTESSVNPLETLFSSVSWPEILYTTYCHRIIPSPIWIQMNISIADMPKKAEREAASETTLSLLLYEWYDEVQWFTVKCKMKSDHVHSYSVSIHKLHQFPFVQLHISCLQLHYIS